MQNWPPAHCSLLGEQPLHPPWCGGFVYGKKISRRYDGYMEDKIFPNEIVIQFEPGHRWQTCMLCMAETLHGIPQNNITTFEHDLEIHIHNVTLSTAKRIRSSVASSGIAQIISPEEFRTDREEMGPHQGR